MDFPSVLKVVAQTVRLVDNSTGTPQYQSDYYILEFLMQKLNFKPDIIEVNETIANVDIARMLYRNVADVAISKLGMLENKYAFADFTVAYGIFDYRFMYETGEESPKFESFILPFSTEVWIFCICAVLIVTLIFGGSASSFFDVFLSVFGSMLKQPMETKKGNPWIRICWETWLVWAGVVSSLYTALFLSYLTVPIKQQGPKTFQELSTAVQNKIFTCRTEIVVVDFMLKSSQEHLRLLAKDIAQNGWLHGPEEIPPTGRTAAWINNRENFDLKELFPPSRIKVYSEDALATQPYCIYVRKDFCCMEQLNRAMLRAIDMGLFAFFQRKPRRETEWLNELRRMQWNDGLNSALKLEDLQYAFYILIIGVVSRMFLYLLN